MRSRGNLRKLDSLETAIGVAFRDKELLRQALAHSSYLNENPGAFALSNERLEFLGDAVIGMAVAGELYRLHPEWSEGELTEARSALVRGDTLARAAKSLRLGHYQYLGKGEEAAGGRERASNLAAAFEALVGALFLDQGYEAAHDFAIGALAPELSGLRHQRSLKSPKSVLQEAVQVGGDQPLSYRIVEESGSHHDRAFTAEVTVGGRVVGRGTGARKSLAEEEAAAGALRAMEQDT